MAPSAEYIQRVEAQYPAPKFGLVRYFPPLEVAAHFWHRHCFAMVCGIGVHLATNFQLRVGLRALIDYHSHTDFLGLIGSQLQTDFHEWSYPHCFCAADVLANLALQVGSVLAVAFALPEHFLLSP